MATPNKVCAGKSFSNGKSGVHLNQPNSHQKDWIGLALKFKTPLKHETPQKMDSQNFFTN